MSKTSDHLTDPCERLIALSLESAGLDFVTDFGGMNPSGLDFRITDHRGFGVEIEVKQFHSPRIAEQMSRADNVIAIQGAKAATFFGLLLLAYGKCHENAEMAETEQ